MDGSITTVCIFRQIRSIRVPVQGSWPKKKISKDFSILKKLLLRLSKNTSRRSPGKETSSNIKIILKTEGSCLWRSCCKEPKAIFQWTEKKLTKKICRINPWRTTLGQCFRRKIRMFSRKTELFFLFWQLCQQSVLCKEFNPEKKTFRLYYFRKSRRSAFRYRLLSLVCPFYVTFASSFPITFLVSITCLFCLVINDFDKELPIFDGYGEPRSASTTTNLFSTYFVFPSTSLGKKSIVTKHTERSFPRFKSSQFLVQLVSVSKHSFCLGYFDLKMKKEQKTSENRLFSKLFIPNKKNMILLLRQ